MANMTLIYGSRTFEVVCDTDAAEKRFIKQLTGTLQLGGLLAVPSTEGTIYLGFPTGVEIALIPSS